MKRRTQLYALGGLLIVVSFAAWRLTDDPAIEPPLIPIAATAVVADSDFDACLECHDDIEQSLQAGLVQLIGFRHEEHFSNSGDVGCGNCHGLDTHDRTPPQAPTMEDCFSCHLDAGPAAELPCLRCHDNATVPPPQSHFTSEWRDVHGSGALLSQSLCETCHSRQDFCTACHGVDIPHPDGWTGYPHARATFDSGIESCARCHERGPELTARDECDGCHHPQNPAEPIWKDAHPEVVRSQGGSTCFECHDPNTCATCHTSGVEDFSADLNRLEVPGPPKVTESPPEDGDS